MSVVDDEAGFARRAVIRLSSIEFWERYSYYNLFTLLPLYVSAPIARGGMGWSGTEALHFFGVYLLLVSAAPVAGGYLVGRWLSARFALRLGAICLFAGHCAIVCSAIMPRGPASFGSACFYFSVGLVAFGNGLFKPVITTVLGRLPHANRAERDASFTAFFLFVNIGGLAAVLIGGWLSQAINWASAFGVAAIGMLIALLALAAYEAKYITPFVPLEARPAPVANRADRADKPFLFPVTFLLVLLIVVAALTYQSYGFVSLFTASHVNRNVGGFVIPPTWFVAVNPLTVMVLTPILVRAWRKGGLGHDWTPITKFVVGFASAGAALACLAGAAAQSGPAGQASALWILLSLSLIAVAELIVTPTGNSVMTRLPPARYQPLAVGAWSAATGVGGWLSGQIGAAALGPHTVAILSAASIISLLMAAVLFPLRGRLASFDI